MSKRVMLILVAIVGVMVLGFGGLFALSQAISEDEPTPDPNVISVAPGEYSLDPGDAEIYGSDENLDNELGLQGSPIEPPIAIESFTAETTTGEPFIYSDYEGDVLLLYFGYMTCPDFCPTTMADLLLAYRELDGVTDDVTVVFFTVDPERDTLDLMSRYVGAFHEDFIGVRLEDQADMQAVLSQFGAVAIRREVDSALGYLVDHTTSLFMVDQQGNLMNRFAYGVEPSVIAHDVRVVLEG